MDIYPFAKEFMDTEKQNKLKNDVGHYKIDVGRNDPIIEQKYKVLKLKLGLRKIEKKDLMKNESRISSITNKAYKTLMNIGKDGGNLSESMSNLM